MENISGIRHFGFQQLEAGKIDDRYHEIANPRVSNLEKGMMLLWLKGIELALGIFSHKLSS
jgi:hypothetical protein